MEFILASASPRRQELLSKAGFSFRVVPADVDENLNIDDPKTLVMELATIKAAHVARMFDGEHVLVIGADTVVSKDGVIMGKPKDVLDAERMLKSLSGACHEVYTGFCCAEANTGRLVSRYACTKVYFKEMTDEDISAYIATKEPMDKAGAYGIQGIGGRFVNHIDGEYSNVVGLPMEALTQMLTDEFGWERS